MDHLKTSLMTDGDDQFYDPPFQGVRSDSSSFLHHYSGDVVETEVFQVDPVVISSSEWAAVGESD